MALPTPLKRLAPDWISTYPAGALSADLRAGLTTTVLLVPQAMAYAMLAGLPPVAGLYASLLPLLLYALVGSSRQLAVGPVAMVSLLTASALGTLGELDMASLAIAGALLAALVGGIQIAMGVAKMGFLVNLLAHPVILGFTFGAALVIGISQLPHVTGFAATRGNSPLETLVEVVSNAGAWHLGTLGIGVASIIALRALKRFAPRVPAALLVVAVSTTLAWFFAWSDAGVAIVGAVPSGLPSFSVPLLEREQVWALLPSAAAIALVGFMESYAVASNFARKHRYALAPNRELTAMGVANLGAGLLRGLPVAGGFSRTAVNASAGAQTQLAAIITAAGIGLTLLFLTPVFTYLPKAVLAALILVAVASLIQLHELSHLWKVKRSDLLLLVITFAATFFIGIEEGLALGVVASLLLFVLRTTRPHVAELGRLPGTDVWRNLANYPEAEQVEGVLALRMDAQFYFGNMAFLQETLARLEAGRREALRAVILDASSINQLDSSAAEALLEMQRAYEDREIRLLFANVKRPVHRVMQNAGLCTALHGDDDYLTVEDAVCAACGSGSPRCAGASGRAQPTAVPHTGQKDAPT